MNSWKWIPAFPWRIRIHARVVICSMVACFVALSWGSCKERPSLPSASQPARANGVRIVSLSPAISRSLVDLDLAKYVVGRSPYCSSLDQAIPVAGDLLAVDYEQMVRLNPTHVLVQPPAKGLDPHFASLANERNWAVGAWRLDGIHDIRSLISGLAAMFGEALPRDDGDALRMAAYRLDERIGSTTSGEAMNIRFTGRLLMVNAVNPPMAFGQGTYLDDILTALGGVNVVADQGWVQLSLEDIVRLAPDAIVLVKPEAKAAELASDLGPLAEMDLPAVGEGRMALLAHPDALLPSSAVVEVAEELSAILRRFAGGSAAADNQP